MLDIIWNAVEDEYLTFIMYLLRSIPMRFSGKTSQMIHNDEAQQDVISIAAIPESSIRGVIGIVRRHGLRLLLSLLGLCPMTIFAMVMGLGQQIEVGLVLPSPVPFGVGWNECFCHVLVQSMQVDIGKHGAANAALGRSTVGLVERMVGGEIALSTANSELCMTLSRHTAPQSMVIWY